MGGIDDYRIAGVNGRHPVANRLHPSGILVAEHTRQRDTGCLHEAVDRVQVGGADSSAAETHEHVGRPAWLGDRDVDELERTVVLAQ